MSRSGSRRTFDDFVNYSFSGTGSRYGSSSRRRSSNRDPYDIDTSSSTFGGYSFGSSSSSSRRRSSNRRDPYDSSSFLEVPSSSSSSRRRGGYSTEAMMDEYIAGNSTFSGSSPYESSSRTSRSSSSRRRGGYDTDAMLDELISDSSSSPYDSRPLPSRRRRSGVDLSSNANDFYDPFAGGLGTGRSGSDGDPELPSYRSASAYAREAEAPPRYSSRSSRSRTSRTETPTYSSFGEGDSAYQYPPTRRPSYYSGSSSRRDGESSSDYYYRKWG